MRQLTAFLTLMLITAPAHAGAAKNAGTSSGEFLKLGADARGAAMGGEMSAASTDASALYWNPAGLARLKERHATLTHSALVESTFLDFAAYAHPVKSLIPTRRREMRPSIRGTLAVGVLYLNAGAINEVDNTGQSTGGSFIPRDAAILTGWGASFTQNLDMGLTLKYIDSRIQAKSQTGTIDLGARYETELIGWPYVLAVNARNLGGTLRFRNQADPLPTSYRIGQTLRPSESLLFTLDLVAPRDQAAYPAFGAEVRLPTEYVDAYLRGGWSGRTASGALDGLTAFSFGFGIGREQYVFDYAWVPFGSLGSTHRLSLGYRF